jgi:AcrR family transcriptional regulator
MSIMDEKKPLTLRERHAAQTRREVLDAALRLFTTQGYSGTTIGQIASEAGVSVQTIYSSVGSKSELIAELSDEMDVSAGTREIWTKLEAAKSGREMIELGVQLVRTFPETFGDLLIAIASASAVEPELNQYLEEGQRRHRIGLASLIKRIDEVYGLKKGMTVERGAAIIAAMTNLSVWHDLHKAHGWSYDEIEAWMTDALSELLLS